MDHAKFPQVPVPVWIAIFCAAIAFAPARNLWRHLGDHHAALEVSPSQGSPADYGSSAALRDLAVVFGAAFVAFFAFTDEAAAFARADWFFPAIVGCVGIVVCGLSWRGWKKGRVEPLIRGINEGYDKLAQPKRFWRR